MTNNQAIIYEQPLNELIRVCLRVEHLFRQLDQQIADTSLSGTRNSITAIMSLLNLLDRPDLKAKLAKELQYYASHLTRLSLSPNIHQEKLDLLLHQLEELAHTFIESSGKIAQKLREIELLNNLRLHLVTPGGGCSFDIPVYHYWLQQPIKQRQQSLKLWITEFDSIRTAIDILLNLIRESAKTQEKMAEHGFYQELLDAQNNLRLIRVSVPHSVVAYPEISVGRHFLSIRYFSPDITHRPKPYLDNLSFSIDYCGG